MTFSRLLTVAKFRFFKEVKRDRPWQSYVVAVGMILGFFLLVQCTLGESPRPVPEAAKVEAKEETQKIEGYQLAESVPKESTWEHETGAVEDVPAVDEKEAPVPEEIAKDDTAGSAADEGSVESASRVTREFYVALNDRDIPAAYGKLSDDFQNVLSFDRFEEGYSSLESLQCEIKRAELVSADQVRLDLQLEVTESGCPSTYFVTCIVAREDGDWRVAGMAQLRS